MNGRVKTMGRLKGGWGGHDGSHEITVVEGAMPDGARFDHQERATVIGCDPQER
jgi:hypothetical protein